MGTIPWLGWVRRLQSIAQAGFTYNNDVYDQERYEQVQDIAAEIAAAHSTTDSTTIKTMYRHEKGYSTPKIDVRGAVFNEKGEILLVKEASTQKWTLPGGWADVWDTPSQAVEREIVEESGYETKTQKLIAVLDRDNQGHPPYEFACWKMYFLCELTGGSATTSHETSDVNFFAEDDLPELDKGRTLGHMLQICFTHYRNPELASEFD